MSTAQRLDVFLAEQRGITRHAARTLIDAGLVRLAGRQARPGHRMSDRDAASLEVLPAPAMPESQRDVAAPTLSIVYEDSWLAVVDKPAGLVVHPGAGHAQGTLADALRARGTTWSLLGGAQRPGIVHRLDRDTSGLLVVAKTERAHRALAAQLRDRSLGRVYWALVHGGFREDRGTVDAPLARDPKHRMRMAVGDTGREAVTDFTVRERFGDVTLLDVSLRTGRTHQIRVHCAYIRHPVLGDAVYGRADPMLQRPALHAARLSFRHPADGEVRVFESAPPAALMSRLEQLRGGQR